MLPDSLLKILCCPETHQPLRVADPVLVEQINAQIARRDLKNRAGKPVSLPVDSGLVRQDGKYLYPVRNDIPVMLVDEAIPL